MESMQKSTSNTQTLTIGFDKSMLDAVKEYQKENFIKARTEAIRQLINVGLKTEASNK